ncbi:MAG TPA: RdgB/HAM1 family non-canonical purine NTP pyrophosphatase [bacterium]|nr:RdgB/HAM1 family non-canonical purine NTP pyrophosphatase [bacterium]
MKLNFYLATKNRDKIKEIQDILKDTGIEVIKCPEDIMFPEETGNTFEENAFIKANYLKNFLKNNIPVVGEDSGLMVEKLGGLPGVKSARFSSTYRDDRKNIEKLLKMMGNIKNKEDRKGKFITVICLIEDHKRKFFKGEVEGIITFQPRGENGFGYDPVFEIPEIGKTFAQLSVEEKNKISHRSIAFRKLAEYLLKKAG